MSKFTPGPWHVVERGNGQAFSIGTQVQTKGNLLTTHYICHITDKPTKQAEADAKLIAAAPEMFEILRRCQLMFREDETYPLTLEDINELIKKVETNHDNPKA